MTPDLAAALDLGHTLVTAWAIVFLRIGSVMALMPAFGERAIPLRVRVVATIAFTAIVAPQVAPLVGSDLGQPGQFPRLMAGEILAGLALGAGFRLFVLALQIAGTIAANMTSLSQILGGMGVDPQPAMAHLLVMAGLALAVMSGLHVKIAVALIGSYAVIPPGALPQGADLAGWITGQVAGTFALAFTLAAPFTIASLVYNLALGAISRAMPQLMVAFVGAPAITAGALILLLLAAPYMLSVWSGAFDRALAHPFGAM